MSVQPKKRLGQHFLVDRNILDVIGRLADLDSEDVVLEVGPGLGVLTRYLTDRVGFVHAVEIDRSLAEPLATALDGAANVRIVYGDALDLDVDALDPTPSKLVANLPYAIATPLVLEMLSRAPQIERFVVMVQREVADRFFAERGTKAYGAVSVAVRLQARRIGFHHVPPTVFRPRPRVESALVALERIEASSITRVRPVVDAAFAHRRKTLANSLAGVGIASRAEAEMALAAIGKSPRARAEELDPADFVVLAEALRT